MNWKQLRDISFFVEIEKEGPGLAGRLGNLLEQGETW
jgi:hypothetical protein